MSRELFVAKIPPNVSVDDLQALFNTIAPVESLKRPRDFETGELRSFAFVTMVTDAGGSAAIEKLNGYEFDGQPIVVKESDKPFAQPAPRPAPRPAAPPPSSKPAVFDWESRIGIMDDLLTQVGTASNAKATVIGRPGKVYENAGTVVIMMQHFARQTGLPKGVPTPPETGTYYVVYMSAKQWRKVSESLANNPDDILIAEGQPIFDPDIPGVAVFATMVNTKLLQMAIVKKTEE
jgi:hypothetical protein